MRLFHLLIAVPLFSTTLGLTFAQPTKDTRNLIVVAPAATAAAPDKRIALVIGNGAYKDAPLLNPVNDARAISQAFRDGGFTVISRENATQRELLDALREFGDRLRGGGVGVFYYAGHGMQIKGRNYLIPVEARIEREDEVAYAAVDAQAVLDKMEAAGNGTNIMILDACRNNPFLRSSRSAQAGLSPMDAPVGTLVAFSTSPGAVASDGTGDNGLYTQHLLSSMRIPGVKVEEVFKQVRSNVRRDSQGKQIPWEATSLEGDFYFSRPTSSTRPTQSAVSESAMKALDHAMWEMVKTSKQALEYRAYLSRFAQGEHATEARDQLEHLTRTAATHSTVHASPPTASLAATATQLAPQATSDSSVAAAAGKIEQRTQELLLEAGKTSAAALGAVPVVQAAAPVKSAPLSKQNSFGFTVGDRWRYQIIDKYKGEVVSNSSTRVDTIDANGLMTWNRGAVVATANGSFIQEVSKRFPTRSYSPAKANEPTALIVGYSEPFKYIETQVRDDGLTSRIEVEGNFKVVATERIKVPAGEFEVIRFERNSLSTAYYKSSTGGGNTYWRTTEVRWYAPSIRHFVAREWETRGTNANSNDRGRQELTSYELAGAKSSSR